MAVKVLHNCHAATLVEGDVPYGMIRNAAIVVRDNKIDWVGPAADIRADLNGAQHIDLGGRVVTPALIDCHTHIVFGGNRALEFEMRLNGASYEEISRAGGGINSTVSATRSTDDDTLLADALTRVDAMMREGVALIEVKSGYGLDLETELRMLRVARRIAEVRDVQIRTTYLGAHAVPPEFKDRTDDYIDDVCIPTLRAANDAGLVDAVDAFCENIAFTAEQVARVFNVARDLGLAIKIHAEQLSNMGGTVMAAGFGAVSADHIEYLDDAGVRAMQKANMTAVVLPGAFYTLHETQAPPIAALRKHGVPIAVATDANPGSSPMTSLLLAMNMGCTLFGMTPEETLAGVTRNAARALDLSDRGIIAKDMRADLAVWDIGDPAELAYRIGFNPLHKRMFGGQI